MLQHFFDFHKIASQLLLFAFHILLYVAITLFKDVVDDEHYFFVYVADLVGQHFVHFGVEGFDFVVDTGDLIAYFGSEVFEALERFNTGRLKAAAIGHETSPDIVAHATAYQFLVRNPISFNS